MNWRFWLWRLTPPAIHRLSDRLRDLRWRVHVHFHPPRPDATLTPQQERLLADAEAAIARWSRRR